MLRAAVCLAVGATAAVCGGADAEKTCFTLAGGTKMPKVAMGTWSGSYKECAKANYTCVQGNALRATDAWLKLGGTHIDSANDYRTQTSVAASLAARPDIKREDLFVTTKCPGAIGFQATIQCADDNLQMLGMLGSKGYGYIDLLLVHFPGTVKPACRFSNTAPGCDDPFVAATKEALQDTWRAMEELKRFGVVKAIGVSDYNTTHLADTLAIAKEPIELNQVEWNPKNHDEGLYRFAQEHNIRMQAWSPLGGAGVEVLSDPVIKGVAARHSVSTAQIALKWALHRGVGVVVGSSNPAHLKSDLDVFSFDLTDDEVSQISALQPSAIIV
jgi:diketogulonate reductase-like aldo/keto reductase